MLPRILKVFFFLFLLCSSSLSVAKDTYIRGFYHGQNVFIRNMYLEGQKFFCIQAIYVNGKIQAEKPDISAVEIDLTHLSLNDRVVLRIVHQEKCTPQLINPEVIQDDLSFSWVKFYVNDHELLWVTSFEDKNGYYIAEKEIGNVWEPLDTVKTKGNIFINQHSIEVKHIPGNNLYRLVYFHPQDEPSISGSFKFFSDKREVSHAIDKDNWTIEFTEEVSFQLLNANGRLIKRGKGESYDIQRLPRGTYILKYENEEVTFEKTTRKK
ncbi:MAG: hypothetical protein ACJAT1_001134 [Marivirga sp.]|jgi:hypothetical protein